MKKHHESVSAQRASANYVALNKQGSTLTNNRPSASMQRRIAQLASSAVPQVAQRRPAREVAIQRRKFKSDSEAKIWMLTKLTDDSLALPSEDDRYDFLSQQLETDAELAKDLYSNVSSLEKVWAEVEEETLSRRALSGLQKRRTLTAKQKDHILKGEFSGGKKIAGGHHAPTCILNGFTIINPSAPQNGFYTATLSKTVNDKVVTKTSTFFPDAWTAADIINAIEYAEHPVPTNPRYIITTPKGKDMELHSNEDSFFPIL